MLLLFISLSRNAFCATPLDPLLGVRVALLATEHLLADPPLPSLSKSKKGDLTLGGSLLLADVNSEGSTAGTFYDGHFTGKAISFGYTFTGSGAIGYFAYFSLNSMSGSSTLGNAGFVTTLNNFDTTTYVGMTGLSMRVLGSDKSPLAAGLLFGPAVAGFSSSFDVSSTGDSSAFTYSSSPTIFGAMAGAQVDLRMGKLLINPYVMYFKELSKHCKSYSTSDSADDGSGFDAQCFASAGARTIGLSSSFLAYGANIGYDNFILNIYSQVAPDSSMSSITLNSFSLSYDFTL